MIATLQKRLLRDLTVEIRRASDGYTAAKVTLGELKRKDLADVLLMVNELSRSQITK